MLVTGADQLEPLPYFQATGWFQNLAPAEQELIRISSQLFERERTNSFTFSDYSFLVFPMAKAYEGFIKRTLFEAKLVSRELYISKRLRIGKALNPDLRPQSRDEQWFYDDVERYCSHDVAQLLWEVWLKCRNNIVHYFPEEKYTVSLAAARSLLVDISSAIEQTVACPLNGR